MSSTLYQVEKGVPLPANVRGIYPWDTMRPGDSFVVPLSKTSTVRSCIRNRTKKHPGEVYVSVKGAKGTRVWRTK